MTVGEFENAVKLAALEQSEERPVAEVHFSPAQIAVLERRGHWPLPKPYLRLAAMMIAAMQSEHLVYSRGR
jgi:hypothetical protein